MSESHSVTLSIYYIGTQHAQLTTQNQAGWTYCLKVLGNIVTAWKPKGYWWEHYSTFQPCVCSSARLVASIPERY